MSLSKNELRGLLERPIAFYPIFAKIGGGAKAGLFLSQLFYWDPRATLDDDWIYKTQAEWQKETCLTRREQEGARRDLKERGLIEEKLRGMPAQMHYRINWPMLAEAVAKALHIEDEAPANKDGGKRQTGMAQSDKQVRTKAPNKDGGKRASLIGTENTSETTQRGETSFASQSTDQRQNAKRLFDAMPAEKQQQLIEQVRQGVPQPLWSKIGQVGSPVSVKLWELVLSDA